MTLTKTLLLTVISTLVKMLAGLVINKAIAVYIGPAGLALVGQFQNFTQLVTTMARGAVNTGVTKYTAEYGSDSHKIPILFSTAGKISLACSIIVGIGLILFSKFASMHFLRSDEYSYVFVMFGFTIILFVVNNLLLSILNGLKEITTYISINIIQSFYSLIFTTILIIFLGLEGALIALVTNQSVVFLIVIWMLRKHQIIKLDNFKKSFDKPEAKKLMGFAAMTLTSAATIPVSHLIVRDYIGKNLGWDQAGYWQAIWYISTMYLMVFTTTLSVYYLPKLSGVVEKKDIRQEIIQGYKIIMPIAILMAIIIFALKDFIIELLFTEEFLSIRELIMWQILGDVIKLSCFMIGYIIVAKALTKIFILKEVFLALIFTLVSLFFIDIYGLIGVLYSYTITCVINLIIVFYIYHKKFRVIENV